jgi:gluconolactonase
MRSLLMSLSGLALILSACSSDSTEQEVRGLEAAGAGGAQARGVVPAEPGNGEAAAPVGSAGSSASPGGNNSGSNEGGPMTSGLVGAAGTSGSAPAGGKTPPAMTPPMMAGEVPAVRPGAASICPPGPFAASPLPAMATPTPVCTGMTFTEGAVWFASLNTLFFSDFTVSNFAGPSRILSFTPGGQCQEFIPNAGTNGLVIAPDGNLLGARHGDQTLTLFNLMTKEATVLVADNAGLAFNSPNDIAVRSDGNLYFTDPDYLRGNRAQEQPTRAYRRDPSGALTVINEGGNTNGITLSPDESRLYVSQLGGGGGGGGNNILVFDVDASGALSASRTFVASVGSDGMAIDCAGNLYTTTNGAVLVFSPEGQRLGTIAAPGAANVAFGGPERSTLFITATTQLLSVELAIPGLPY